MSLKNYFAVVAQFVYKSLDAKQTDCSISPFHVIAMFPYRSPITFKKLIVSMESFVRSFSNTCWQWLFPWPMICPSYRLSIVVFIVSIVLISKQKLETVGKSALVVQILHVVALAILLKGVNL